MSFVWLFYPAEEPLLRDGDRFHQRVRLLSIGRRGSRLVAPEAGLAAGYRQASAWR